MSRRFQEMKCQFEQIRSERQFVREFKAASPRLREEYTAAVRNSQG